jgi:HSP20 family molecular chaperone IbpA
MMREFTFVPFFTALEDLINLDPTMSIKPKDFYCAREFPGVKKDEIEITSDGKTLLLEVHSTRYQRYSERFTLPEKMYDYNAIKVTYEEGLLEIRLPLLKTEEKKELKKIEIK